MLRTGHGGGENSRTQATDRKCRWMISSRTGTRHWPIGPSTRINERWLSPLLFITVPFSLSVSKRFVFNSFAASFIEIFNFIRYYYSALSVFFFSHASILWRCPSVFLIYFSLSYLLFISEMLFLVTSLDCLRLILYWSMTVFYFQD